MFTPDLLGGKRILVTGGGTGLGKSMSRRFLEPCARGGRVNHRDSEGRPVSRWSMTIAVIGIIAAVWSRP